MGGDQPEGRKTDHRFNPMNYYLTHKIKQEGVCSVLRVRDQFDIIQAFYPGSSQFSARKPIVAQEMGCSKLAP